MAPLPKRLLATVCAVALAGCGSGGDGTIPSSDAEELIASLDAIDQALADGNCTLIAGHAESFSSDVSELPNEVDTDVQRALAESAARLSELSGDSDQCETDATAEDEVEPDTTDTETTETSTSTTTTEEETTDDETEDDAEEAEDDEQAPAEPDPGEGDPKPPAEGEQPPEIEIGPSETGGVSPEERETP